MVRELAQLHPAALEMMNTSRKTPLHLAAEKSNSVAMIRELAQLYPAALEMKNADGDTPLHLAVIHSDSVEIVRELASLSPAALVTMNAYDETPLAVVTSPYRYDDVSEVQGKLQVLLEAAPQAAGIACSSDRNRLALYQILQNSSRRFVTLEMVAMVLAAYKDAVNIPDDDGWLPVHFAAEVAPVDILKMIALENMSNLSVIVPFYGSAAHIAVFGLRVDNLRYIHAMMPELLLSVDDSNRTHLRMMWTSHLRIFLVRYRLLRGFCSAIVPAWPLPRTRMTIHCTTAFQRMMLGWSMPAGCCCWRGLRRCILVCCRR
jgi:hypothetical protein